MKIMEDKQLIAHLNSVLVFKNNNLRSEHEVSVAKYLSQSTCRRVRVAGHQSQCISRRDLSTSRVAMIHVFPR